MYLRGHTYKGERGGEGKDEEKKRERRGRKGKRVGEGKEWEGGGHPQIFSDCYIIILLLRNGCYICSTRQIFNDCYIIILLLRNGCYICSTRSTYIILKFIHSDTIRAYQIYVITVI